MNYPNYLSCPVIREATSEDAEELAHMVVHSNSHFIDSVFNSNKEGGYEVLKKHYANHNKGIYVLQEGEEIVGCLKIHLPDQLLGNTISYIELIKLLGLKGGIRAGILLSHWDEYKLSPQEAYIEYIYVHENWEGFGVKKTLLQRAYELAEQAGAHYITHFIPDRNYKDKGLFETNGFVFRKRIHSVLAKVLGSKHTSWYKATYSIVEGPITVKEYVVEKIDNIKQIWSQRRREILAAVRLTIALTIFPVIAGFLAYIRGYYLAAGGWVIVLILHLLGVKLYLSGYMIGRYGLIIAMISEGINLISRTISSPSWFTRTWLLPIAFLTFWVCSVAYRYPVNGETNPTAVSQ